MIPEILLKQMHEVFLSYKEIEKVILFGSRATNTEKPNSDIDIAIITSCSNLLLSEKIKYELDIIPTLLKFDVLCYNDIKNEELKKNIDKDGIVIYKNIVSK